MDGPRACLPEEDVEIVDLINLLFREGTGQDTRTDYPLLYDPAMLHNRRIIKLDGKVVAHVPVCCQSAKVGQIGTRENCCYGEAALSFLTVRL